jgi:hypothetical protein
MKLVGSANRVGDAVGEGVTSGVTGMVGGVASGMAGVRDGVTSGVTGMVGGVSSGMTGVMGGVGSMVSSAGRARASVSSAASEGVDGLRSMGPTRSKSTPSIAVLGAGASVSSPRSSRPRAATTVTMEVGVKGRGPTNISIGTRFSRGQYFRVQNVDSRGRTGAGGRRGEPNEGASPQRGADRGRPLGSGCTGGVSIVDTPYVPISRHRLYLEKFFRTLTFCW